MNGFELQQVINESVDKERAYLRGTIENLQRERAELMLRIAGLEAALKYAQQYPQPLGERPELPQSAVPVPTSPRGD